LSKFKAYSRVSKSPFGESPLGEDLKLAPNEDLICSFMVYNMVSMSALSERIGGTDFTLNKLVTVNPSEGVKS
jgi:hypothetical protein